MFRLGTLVFALWLAGSANAFAATAVKFGKLWDGHRVVPNAVVVVDNGRIVSVAANGAIPSGAETIDLSRYTGLPGLIDSHTHMTFFWDPASGTNPLRQPPRHVAVRVFLPGLVARVGEIPVLIGALILAGATYACFPLLHNAALLAAASFVLGLGLGVSNPMSMTMTYNSSPAGRSGEGPGMRVTVNKLTQTFGQNVVSRRNSVSTVTKGCRASRPPRSSGRTTSRNSLPTPPCGSWTGPARTR